MSAITQVQNAISDIITSRNATQSPNNNDKECGIKRDVILHLFRNLRKIFYPKYFGMGDPDLIIQSTLPLVYDNLRHQISLACKFCNQTNSTSHISSEEIAIKFIKEIPVLIQLLEKDVLAAMDGDPAAKSRDEILLCYPGFLSVFVYRIAHRLYEMGVPLIPRILTEYAHSRSGCDIHPGAIIDEYFFIDHATGVVIGETTQIGKHVKLYQHVTLGALSFKKDDKGNLVKGTKRHPTVEDHVIIYSGTTVLGGNTVIGEGSVLGGNCWITESIKPYTKVIMDKPSMKYMEIKRRA